MQRSLKQTTVRACSEDVFWKSRGVFPHREKRTLFFSSAGGRGRAGQTGAGFREGRKSIKCCTLFLPQGGKNTGSTGGTVVFYEKYHQKAGYCAGEHRGYVSIILTGVLFWAKVVLRFVHSAEGSGESKGRGAGERSCGVACSEPPVRQNFFGRRV